MELMAENRKLDFEMKKSARADPKAYIKRLADKVTTAASKQV